MSYATFLRLVKKLGEEENPLASYPQKASPPIKEKETSKSAEKKVFSVLNNPSEQDLI